MRRKVDEIRLKNVNNEKKVIKVNKQEENTCVKVARKLKSEHGIERIEKVESGLIVKKCEIRMAVKSTNEEENRNRRMMIFNLKKKEGNSDVEFVNDVFEKMGLRKSCEDVVDVMRLRQREDGANIRPIIVEFRSEYDNWTVIRMKTKLRECEDYRRVLELDLWRKMLCKDWKRDNKFEWLVGSVYMNCEGVRKKRRS